jgi:hypothetical protein
VQDLNETGNVFLDEVWCRGDEQQLTVYTTGYLSAPPCEMLECGGYQVYTTNKITLPVSYPMKAAKSTDNNYHEVLTVKMSPFLPVHSAGSIQYELRGAYATLW